MIPAGTYTRYPSLVEPLPPLVRKQRRAAARIAKVALDVKDDEALRKEIDALLVTAGLTKGDVVTCLGYDVRHNERDGQEKISRDLLVAQLTAADVDDEAIAGILGVVTETGKPSAFCTVTPTKGAKVRT